MSKTPTITLGDGTKDTEGTGPFNLGCEEFWGVWWSPTGSGGETVDTSCGTDLNPTGRGKGGDSIPGRRSDDPDSYWFGQFLRRKTK